MIRLTTGCTRKSMTSTTKRPEIPGTFNIVQSIMTYSVAKSNTSHIITTSVVTICQLNYIVIEHHIYILGIREIEFRELTHCGGMVKKSIPEI